MSKLTRRQAIRRHRRQWKLVSNACLQLHFKRATTKRMYGSTFKKDFTGVKYDIDCSCWCCEYNRQHSESHLCMSSCILIWPDIDHGCMIRTSDYRKFNAAFEAGQYYRAYLCAKRIAELKVRPLRK